MATGTIISTASPALVRSLHACARAHRPGRGSWRTRRAPAALLSGMPGMPVLARAHFGIRPVFIGHPTALAGHHSANKQAKIKPAVHALILREGLQYEVDNVGAYTIFA